MKIAMIGGGSGGHITPLLAVADKIKELRPDTEIEYIGQRGDDLGDIPAQHKSIDKVFTVRAGKFRRYHGEGWRQLLDVQTVLNNIIDIWWVFVGYCQSLSLLRQLRPDIIFVKGGFVGVPVGLAAATLRIPYITHDSDAIPGLANRIIARWAKLHTVALPKEVYSYPQAKTEMVGVPISDKFYPLKKSEILDLKSALDLPTKSRVILVTGGGLGAQRMNDAIADNASAILGRYPDSYIVHIAGRKLEAELRSRYKNILTADEQKRVAVKGFITNMHQYSGLADVVITRAGGTSMAEFAAQAKACIVIPNPLLTGGHQIKNAKVLADKKLIALLPEDRLMDDHGALMPILVGLLDQPERAQKMGQQLHKITPTDATQHLAMILLNKGQSQ